MKKLFQLSVVAMSLFSLANLFGEAIQFRGVVEGYYGRPWGTEGRLSLLNFMGENDMNVFIYGPKDDPYHHSKWREAYPQKEMDDFAKLLKVANKNKIHFYWAIHLGGSFDEKKEEDFSALNQKLIWMYEAGFRAFAVFFDDYGNADAMAHSRICNRLVKEFLATHKDCAPLIMCPNVYWGNGSEYQKTLGNELDQKVNIMWTGRGICHNILASDVAKITRDLKRAPFVWWNWPVNDYCPSKLLIGRTYGLESAPLAGFVTNPMENCEASKIAIYSIAKWCKDPENFDSRKSWEESFEKLYKDPKIAKAMRIFAEHNSDPGDGWHKFRREESCVATNLCSRARDEFATTGKISIATRDELKKIWNELHDVAMLLDRELPKSRYDLGWEIEGWLQAQIALMNEGVATLDLIASNSDSSRDSLLKEIFAIREKNRESSKRHKEKFANATFANARSRVATPVASSKVFLPLIETMLQTELIKLYEKKTGKSVANLSGITTFSNVKAWKSPMYIREDNVVKIAPVMEYIEIARGESFGLSIPTNWTTTGFYVNLDDEKLFEKGVGLLEFSNDGENWQVLEGHGSKKKNYYFNPANGWHKVRFRNVSDKPIKIKIVEFLFATRDAVTAIDEVLNALLEK